MDNNPTYINEIVKHVTIRKSITKRELVVKVHQITIINPNEPHIHLTYTWLVAHGHYQVVGTSGNDNTNAMLELYPIVNTIELYVKKDTVAIECMKVMENSHVSSIWTMNQRASCPQYKYVSNHEFYSGVYISLFTKCLDDINI